MKETILKYKFYTGEEVYSSKLVGGEFKIEKFKICYVRATIIGKKVFVSYLDFNWREFSEGTCFKTLKGVKSYIARLEKKLEKFRTKLSTDLKIPERLLFGDK